MIESYMVIIDIEGGTSQGASPHRTPSLGCTEPSRLLKSLLSVDHRSSLQMH